MNTRKDNLGVALAAWRKLSPGHIRKPLKHLRVRVSDITFKVYYHAAKKGRGEQIQSAARKHD